MEPNIIFLIYSILWLLPESAMKVSKGIPLASPAVFIAICSRFTEYWKLDFIHTECPSADRFMLWSMEVWVLLGPVSAE